MGGKSSKPKFNNCEDAIKEVENNNNHGSDFWDNICEICECRNYLLNNKNSDSNITYWYQQCNNNDRKSNIGRCVTYKTLKSNPNANINTLQTVPSSFWNSNFRLGFNNIEPFIEGNKDAIFKLQKQVEDAEKGANNVKQSVVDAKKAANNIEQSVVDVEKAGNNAEKAGNNAEKAGNNAEKAANYAEKAANNASSANTNAQQMANSASNIVITSAINTQKKAKQYAANAQTAQEGAITAQEGAVTAQKQTEKILDDVEDDIGSGVITSEAINPITQSTRINGDKRNLENLKSNVQKITDSFMNMFNSNKEGFDIIDFVNAYVDNEEQRITLEEKELQEQVNDIKKDQGLEFGALRNDIMGKLLMDYMINEEGTNIEKVYSKLNQENNDALRKIQISNYYTKSYKEYINLLKIILIAIAIIIPILIFNRLEIINKDISLLSITLIILLTSLFCIYKIYLLYMKDPINFDKIKIPYDRQMRELVDQKKLKNKDSPFKSAGITCIGDECCDDDMMYDNLRNKCIIKTQETQENFHNYFENTMKINNSNKTIIKQNDIPESQKTFSCLDGNSNIINHKNFIEGFTNRRNLLQQLTNASLKNSTFDKFDSSGSLI